MARTIETNEAHEDANLNAPEAWAKAAASRKYGIHNGTPYVGAEGHVVPLPAPDWFRNVPVASRGTVFQALAEYVGNRVAQPLAKAEGKTHDDIVRAAHSALTNGFDPTRARDKDPVEAEVERRFYAFIRSKILEKAPDATDAQIQLRVDTEADTNRGRAKMAEFRNEMLESGVIPVQRKPRKGAAPTLGEVEVSYD